MRPFLSMVILEGIGVILLSAEEIEAVVQGAGSCEGNQKGRARYIVPLRRRFIGAAAKGTAKDAASAAEGVELDGGDGLGGDGHFAF
jgi:hypothetical protein